MELAENGLHVIKKRYFCELLGEVRHLSECEINRVKKPRFCSCGLLHDLSYYFIFSNFTEVVYPNYQKDVYLQISDKIKRNIHESEDYKECRDLIVKVFGNTFPNALTRLQGRTSNV